MVHFTPGESNDQMVADPPQEVVEPLADVPALLFGDGRELGSKEVAHKLLVNARFRVRPTHNLTLRPSRRPRRRERLTRPTHLWAASIVT